MFVWRIFSPPQSQIEDEPLLRPAAVHRKAVRIAVTGQRTRRRTASLVCCPSRSSRLIDVTSNERHDIDETHLPDAHFQFTTNIFVTTTAANSQLGSFNRSHPMVIRQPSSKEAHLPISGASTATIRQRLLATKQRVQQTHKLNRVSQQSHVINNNTELTGHHHSSHPPQFPGSWKLFDIVLQPPRSGP